MGVSKAGNVLNDRCSANRTPKHVRCGLRNANPGDTGRQIIGKNSRPHRARIVRLGKAMNSGAAKFTDPPALDDERSGSTAKKK